VGNLSLPSWVRSWLAGEMWLGSLGARTSTAGLVFHSCEEELPKDLLEPRAAQDILSKGIYEGKKKDIKKKKNLNFTP